MNVTQVRKPDHQCHLPGTPREGEVLRCEECGTYWLGHQPPNWHYWRWTRLTWLGRKLRGIR